MLGIYCLYAVAYINSATTECLVKISRYGDSACMMCVCGYMMYHKINRWINVLFFDSCTLDEMGQRVDELEQNISQLMQQVGSDDKDPAVAANQEIKREK